jgi:5-methylcytosine-specific restriction endonuclease McrA
MVATLETTALNSPVLVLNKGWVAIDATSAREAITDVMAEKAQVVHPRSFTLHGIDSWMEQDILDGDRFIQAARQRILVPEVVVNHYEKIPRRTVVFSRRNLWKRDRFRCQYCGKRPRADEISVDHVVPKAIWNRQNHEKSVTCFENCVLACTDCNKKKDNRTSEQAGMRLRRMVEKNGVLRPQHYDRPKAPSWSPIYAIRRFSKFPESWAQFLKTQNDELYWNVELEEA